MSGRQTKQRRKAWSKVVGPILIVDDEKDDAKLTKRAIESLHPMQPIRLLISGKELLAYLEGKPPYSNRDTHPLPSMVLLDLKMPEMDGFAVLEWMKQEAKYANIPIIVVSALEDSANLKRAYSLHASSYLFKPVNLESIRGVLASLNIAI